METGTLRPARKDQRETEYKKAANDKVMRKKPPQIEDQTAAQCVSGVTGAARGTKSYQHVSGVEVALAGHALLQLLRHLLDVLDLVQQIQDVFVLNPFDPQLAQLVPLAVQQHLAGQQILLHLQATHQQINQVCPCNRCLTQISPCPHLPGIPKVSQDNQSPINFVVVPLAEVKQYEHQNRSHRETVFSAGSVPVVKIQSKYHNVNKCRILLTMTEDLFACFPKNQFDILAYSKNPIFSESKQATTNFPAANIFHLRIQSFCTSPSSPHVHFLKSNYIGVQSFS